MKREAFSSHFRKPVFTQPEHVIESDRERRERLRAEPQGDLAILGRLLVVLGAPQGRKTAQQFGLPCWLGRAPDAVRRRFVVIYLLNVGSNGPNGTCSLFGSSALTAEAKTWQSIGRSTLRRPTFSRNATRGAARTYLKWIDVMLQSITIEQIICS